MIAEFRGEYRFLSNFYPAPVMMDGVLYQTVEHAYQAAKSFDDKYRFKIFKLTDPGHAKFQGQHIKLRNKWDEVKDEVMYKLLQKKFRHPHLRKQLLDTENQNLKEGNHWHDNYWGDCKCKKCKEINGQNKLGTLLMKVRKEIIEDDKNERKTRSGSPGAD